MFKLSRRRDHSLQPLTKETADPDAATAAASAFMRGKPAQSLSSAAAAAALRALPNAPTNVSEISTKRAQRRTSSLSSPAGRERGKKNKQQRSPSVGSMSERTFRSPSPGHTVSKKQDVPPVPSISASKTSTIPLHTQNFKTASQKSEGRQQGSWFGAATTQQPYQEKRAESVSKLSPDLPESRSGSVSSSINFSYPRPRLASYDSHVSSDNELVYDPNSRRMVSKDTLLPINHQTEDAASKTTEKLKGAKLVKRSQISQGLNDETKPAIPDNIQTEPFLTTTGQSHVAGASHDKANVHTSSSSNSPMPPTVEERPSQEIEFEGERPGDWQSQLAPQNKASDTLEPSMAPSFPEHDYGKNEMHFAYAGSGSETSVRSAHFASSTDHLVIKHEPPPRSLSPRKSAMKPAVSIRGSQSSHPYENAEYQVLTPSHSNTEDSLSNQRKSARVSWSDNSTVRISEPIKFEEADFATAHGTQTRQNAYSAMEGSKVNKTSSLQQDELMSPRPALPLFGSVRDKKGKEPEERQLVRPRERSLSPQSQTPSHSHVSSSTPKNETISPVESVKGFRSYREQTPRNVANISKYREPLPVITASTESLEHDSEDMDSSDEERFEDVSTDADAKVIQQPSRDVQPESSLLSQQSTSETSKPNSKATDVSPGISKSDTHSPLLAHQNVEHIAESNTLPGSFPNDDDIVGPRMGDVGDSIIPRLSQTSRSRDVVRDQLIDEKQEEESDKDSIYSDAYEDLSEATNGGFMSLDAALADPQPTEPDNKNLSFGTSTEQKSSDNALDISFQSSDDWERTKAYWKSLTSEERRRLEMEALQEAADDGTSLRWRVAAKALNAEQKNRIQQSQIKHPLQGDSSTLGTTTRHSIAFQDYASGSGAQDQSRKNDNKARKRGGESMGYTGTDLKDAQRGHGLLPQPVATTQSGFRKLVKLRRSTGSEQRHTDNEIRGSLSRPKPSYNTVISTESDQRRQQPQATDGPIIDPMLNTGMKTTLRRRGSDSSESSFVRSRAIANPRRGLRVSMRSNSSEPRISLGSKKGGKRLTLRSLSPSTSHAQHHSGRSIPPPEPLMEDQRQRRLHQNVIVPHMNRPLSRKDEDSTYDGHISDSSDDDTNTTSLTNRSMTGDEYEPGSSRLKHSIIHMHTRNSLPDQNSSANTGFYSTPPRHDTSRFKSDQFYDEGNMHIPLDQRSSSTAPPGSLPSYSATPRPQEASSRRQGLISTLRRKRDGNVKEPREMIDAATNHDTIFQHNPENAVHTRSSGIQAQGWPLQNREGGHDEGSVTSPFGELRRSAASGSIVKDDLTSDPRQQHELHSSDARHANILLSPEPKRKKFNGLRKMFKINN